MKVAFQTNQLSIRGTEVALYDYAHFNETILNNESLVLTKKNHHFPHDKVAVEKFENRFKVLYYDNWQHAENLMKENNIDVLYTIKAGVKDEVESKNIKTCVHAVFQMYEPHGDVYAYISKWLSDKMTGGKAPYVDFMVYLPDVDEDMREELNIPKNAIVFGRHGGHTTFNIPFAINVVNRIVQQRDDIYFLFLNTQKECENFRNIRLIDHKQIIHLPVTSDMKVKTKFINSCDAMLHARVNGESFGLAPAEFSIRNKPVISWTGKDVHKYYAHKHDLAHVGLLGDKGIFYNDEIELERILNGFKPQPEKNWDAYSELYNPTVIMEKFKNVFLD